MISDIRFILSLSKRIRLDKGIKISNTSASYKAVYCSEIIRIWCLFFKMMFCISINMNYAFCYSLEIKFQIETSSRDLINTILIRLTKKDINVDAKYIERLNIWNSIGICGDMMNLIVVLNHDAGIKEKKTKDNMDIGIHIETVLSWLQASNIRISGLSKRLDFNKDPNYIGKFFEKVYFRSDDYKDSTLIVFHIDDKYEGQSRKSYLRYICGLQMIWFQILMERIIKIDLKKEYDYGIYRYKGLKNNTKHTKGIDTYLDVRFLESLIILEIYECGL